MNLHRRWFAGFVLDPELAPTVMKDEANHWRDNAFRGNLRPCWTFRGAGRLVHRLNGKGRHSPFGTWEVFGPAGKGDD